MSDKPNLVSSHELVTVRSLGHRGDGIAQFANQVFYVPFAVPGDSVLVSLSLDGTVKVEKHSQVSPLRVEPSCEYFSRCGGCSVQQLQKDDYNQWKQNILLNALKRRDIDASILEPMIEGGPRRRRRVRFHFVNTKDGIVFGYRLPQSHRIIQINRCPLIGTVLENYIQPLRTAFSDLFKGKTAGEVTLTAANEGVDLLLIMEGQPDLLMREKLAALAHRLGLVRISWKQKSRNGKSDLEIILTRKPVTICLGDTRVNLPADGFVQPTAEGEMVLISSVISVLRPGNLVLDLFAGSGTFSLAAAKARAQVHAVEFDSIQLESLKNAAKLEDLSELVTCENRDLKRRPLLEPELRKFDVVVLDPPRAGAENQVKQLAKSNVPKIVYISCNPVTFARDAQNLVRAKYTLEKAQPIDQFFWSPHLELVGVFKKN